MYCFMMLSKITFLIKFLFTFLTCKPYPPMYYLVVSRVEKNGEQGERAPGTPKDFTRLYLKGDSGWSRAASLKESEQGKTALAEHVLRNAEPFKEWNHDVA